MNVAVAVGAATAVLAHMRGDEIDWVEILVLTVSLFVVGYLIQRVFAVDEADEK